MLTIPEDKTIYVYTEPVDMRKAINGLVILLVESFDQNPQTGDYYLFVGLGLKIVQQNLISPMTAISKKYF